MHLKLNRLAGKQYKVKAIETPKKELYPSKKGTRKKNNNISIEVVAM